MLNLLDIALEPGQRGTNEIGSLAKSTPWLAAYIVVGVLICVAVFLIIKRIIKTKK